MILSFITVLHSLYGDKWFMTSKSYCSLLFSLTLSISWAAIYYDATTSTFVYQTDCQTMVECASNRLLSLFTTFQSSHFSVFKLCLQTLHYPIYKNIICINIDKIHGFGIWQQERFINWMKMSAWLSCHEAQVCISSPVWDCCCYCCILWKNVRPALGFPTNHGC